MTNDAQLPTLSVRLGNIRPLSAPALPSFELIERTIRRVLDKYDAPATPPDREAERLFSEMSRRIDEGDWDKVPLSFVTGVAALAFSIAYRLREDLARIRNFLIAEVEASDRAGFLNPMVRVYMESYEAGAAHTRDLARALTMAKPKIGARWRGLLTEVPEILDPQTAPAAIASLMDEMPNPWHGLRARGLRQPHAPGLMDASHLSFVDRIAPRLGAADEIERLLGWLKPDQKTLRQVGVGRAIEALISVWKDRKPPSDIQALLIDKLTLLYGHPKVSRNAVWNEVDPALEHLFLRWLTGSDIRFLFSVLTEVERKHMFADRERFWWALYEQGRIDEIWIAFNDDGYHAASKKMHSDSLAVVRRFGRQVGEFDKSLLIMRIGKFIVVEGTYNFKVHIFLADHPRAPKLYQSRYDVSDIRGRPYVDAIMHQGQHWTDRVLMRIAR